MANVLILCLRFDVPNYSFDIAESQTEIGQKERNIFGVHKDEKINAFRVEIVRRNQYEDVLNFIIMVWTLK